MARSVIHAVMQFYDALPAAAFPGGVRPPIFFGMAPVASAGQMIRPPYVVVTDDGITPDYQTDGLSLETTSCRVEVYAEQLGVVDDIVTAIRFGGQPPAQRAGLDWAVLPLDPPYQPVQMSRTGEVRKEAGWSYQGHRVYLCRLYYEALIELV